MTIGTRMIGLINAFERAVQVNSRTPAKHANKADTLARVETARARLTKAIEIVSGVRNEQ